MATDIKQVVENLCKFYDFGGKTLIAVGAGGGQLIEYARTTKKVLAVDSSREALLALRQRVVELGWGDRFNFREGDFPACADRGDVVLFEFCLHEMTSPAAALSHASGLAPDVVIIDHLPDSPWAYLVAEEAKAAASWSAIHATCVRRFVRHKAEHRFAAYADLEIKCRPQGQESMNRIAKFKAEKDICIPMLYGLALV